MARVWGRWVKEGGHASPEKSAPAASGDPINTSQMQANIIDRVEEGILLVHGPTVQWLNPAARLMFPAVERPVGRPLVEVVRDHRIDTLAVRVREAGVEPAAEIEVPGAGGRLQVGALRLANSSV